MEQTCQYHPLEPATYFCSDCESSCCDYCVDDSSYNPVARCFQCNRTLDSLGPGNIEPFWRFLFWFCQYCARLLSICHLPY